MTPERALAGVTVVVTRPAEQAAGLVELLRDAGATPVPVPLIRIVDVDEGEVAADLARAVADLAAHDWVVVASPNGAVRAAPAIASTAARVAAVGATTAATLAATLGRVDLRPQRQSAEGLVAEMPAAPPGGRAVVVQSADGAPSLTDGLRALGWSVTRVDTHRAERVRPTLEQRFAALRADAVAFTSGSQASAWFDAFGDTTPPVVVAIGPQTAAAATGLGLKVSAVAADHSLAGVVAALVRSFQR